MSSPWSQWQELALVALGTLSLFYALFFRVWSAAAVLPDLVFAFSVAAAVASVALPGLFDAGARRVVEWSPLPAALGEADARAAALAALPSRLVDGALARLGFDDDVPSESETDAPLPTNATDVDDPLGAAIELPDAASAGVFSAHIRPSIEGLVSLLLRVATLAGSGLGLLLAIALRLVTGLARRLRRLGERVANLERAATPSATHETTRELPS